MVKQGPSVGALQYRCVCGQLTPCDPGQGGVCASCGRQFSPEALRLSLTVTVDSAGKQWAPQGPDDALIGQRLDHFQVLEVLGSGGMGSVYRALDESLERYVALKVIRSEHRDPEQVKRLMQEAIAQARVNHPHIAHVYYVKRDEQTPFLAMELATGGTLADRLKQRGPLAFREVVALAEQLTDALRHAAEFDIVHGDIKPSNILISADGRAKLADFGLARRRSQLRSVEEGPISGTPYYLAPEADAGGVLDEKADMYALGVTLFELTFGRLPYHFGGQTLADAMHTHRQSPIQFPEPWPIDTPERWRTILARLLAKTPERRYESYQDLLRDLRQVRPLSLPDAGKVQRMLAWVFDMFLLTPPTVLAAALAAFDWIGGGVIRPLASLLLWMVILLLTPVFQARFKGTPGKWLFQLKIVDQHGLTPSARVLGWRMIIQMLPIWVVALGQLPRLLGFPLGVEWSSVPPTLALLALLIDGSFMFFGHYRRTLHDRFFRTRVVLAA